MSNSFLTAIFDLSKSKEQKKRIKLYRELIDYVNFFLGCSESELASNTTKWPISDKMFTNKLVELATYDKRTSLATLNLLFLWQKTCVATEKQIRYLEDKFIRNQNS